MINGISLKGVIQAVGYLSLWQKGLLLHRPLLYHCFFSCKKTTFLYCYCLSDMEFLEVLTEGLNRVLLVRGGGREVITIYSWRAFKETYSAWTLSSVPPYQSRKLLSLWRLTHLKEQCVSWMIVESQTVACPDLWLCIISINPLTEYTKIYATVNSLSLDS